MPEYSAEYKARRSLKGFAASLYLLSRFFVFVRSGGAICRYAHSRSRGRRKCGRRGTRGRPAGPDGGAQGGPSARRTGRGNAPKCFYAAYCAHIFRNRRKDHLAGYITISPLSVLIMRNICT